MGDDGASLVTHSKSKSLKSEGHLSVNGNFRLWITTQSDVGRLIPGNFQLPCLCFTPCLLNSGKVKSRRMKKGSIGSLGPTQYKIIILFSFKLILGHFDSNLI